MAIGMLVLFSTGFLRMEWMSKRAVLEAAERQNLEVTQDQVVALYKVLREPMWRWHVYAAYLVTLCFGIRIVYMMARGLRFPNPFQQKISVRERIQGSVYLLFYLFILESMVTGFYLKWIAGSWKESFETVHKLVMYLFPIFIAGHLIGIWIAEHGRKRGIASKMIGGDR